MITTQNLPKSITKITNQKIMKNIYLKPYTDLLVLSTSNLICNSPDEWITGADDFVDGDSEHDLF